MRLTSSEVIAIRRAVLASDPSAIIYLFGSRANDQRRGGDIDLLIESKIIGLRQKLDILVAIKSEIGEQKVDLFVTKDLTSDTDPFVRSIAREVIKL